jgi:hypothetical protein
MINKLDPGWPDLASWASISPNPYQLAGRTENFVVYYDRGMGSTLGGLLSRAIIDKCEIDYAAVRRWFGGIQPRGRPYSIYLDSGSFGAFHADCQSTGIHVATFGGISKNLACMLLVAEVAETFMAAQTRGWDCKGSVGEGLSRVLAGEQYPVDIKSYGTAKYWLDGGRPDWVSRTESSDRNPVSVGCAALYLNYLRYVMGYSWDAIIRCSGGTLAETRSRLSGREKYAYVGFTNLLQRRYPPGVPSGVRGDNPFPLPGHPSVDSAGWRLAEWPPAWA